MISVCDLHCDLLSYLTMKEGRDYYGAESRCSLPQLKKGKVSFQALAIFSETKRGSTEDGLRQVKAYQKLPSAFTPLKPSQCYDPNSLFVMPCFESASAFAEEEEPLNKSFARFAHYAQEIGPFFYISLTWNSENRFGGGNNSKVGLKKDGQALLEYLEGRDVAVDLSHTSDALAYDILNHIEKRGLKLKVMASHSNFRSVNNHPRNLPDDIAKEISKRKGVIGINLFRAFVGNSFEQSFVKIIAHALHINVGKSLCFGADFFCDTDFTSTLSYPQPFYHENFGDASCYPKLQNLLEEHFPLEIVEDMSYKNFWNFFEKKL